VVPRSIPMAGPEVDADDEGELDFEDIKLIEKLL
jgi:hypothetical protein